MTIADYAYSAYEVLHQVGNDPAVQKALADAKAGHADYLEIGIAIAKAGYAAEGSPSPAQIVAAIESVFHPAPATA